MNKGLLIEKEIKEILDILIFNKENILNRICRIEDFISREQIIKLLDYITNLQEFYIDRTDKYQEILLKCFELKKKISFNEKSRRKMERSLMKQIETYKQRNKKAIDYIKSFEYYIPEDNKEDLLNILGGVPDE
jgi:hypothetical protein